MPEHGKVYPYALLPEGFSLGEVVYVKGDQSGRLLQATPLHGGTQFFTTSIDQPTDEHRAIFSKWTHMPLRAVITVRENPVDGLFVDDIETVYRQVSQHLTRDDVEKALKNGSLKIHPSKIGSTDGRRSSAVAILTTVADRLQLCDNLKGHAAADLMGVQQRNLVIYLLITCFDRLGQPHQFADFGNFLEAKRGQNKSARDKVMQDNPGLNGIDLSKALYRAYQEKFGVKNSFMLFIDEVLNDTMREQLRASVMMMNTPYRPHRGATTISTASFEDVKNLLFQIRNNYTHKAEWTPGLTIPISPEVAEENGADEERTFYFYDQRREKTGLVSIAFKSFPQVLFDCVRFGLTTLQNVG